MEKLSLLMVIGLVLAIVEGCGKRVDREMKDVVGEFPSAKYMTSCVPNRNSPEGSITTLDLGKDGKYTETTVIYEKAYCPDDQRVSTITAKGKYTLHGRDNDATNFITINYGDSLDVALHKKADVASENERISKLAVATINELQKLQAAKDSDSSQLASAKARVVALQSFTPYSLGNPNTFSAALLDTVKEGSSKVSSLYDYTKVKTAKSRLYEFHDNTLVIGESTFTRQP